MTRIWQFVLLFIFVTIICDLEICIASDFGIKRRGITSSVNQSRDYTQLPSRNRIYTESVNSSLPLSSAPSSTSANTAQPNQPFPNIARLVAFDKKGQSFGSCSYIGGAGNYGIIISNWHVICEADGLVHVYFPSGFSSFGAIIKFDSKWDLAVIVISKPPVSIPPLPIMQTAPRQGEPLWIAGYGSGSYRIASGYCVEYLAPEIPRNGMAPSYEIIKLSTTARQGDSGGPILNRKGELAGVLFGSDMVTSTAGSHCERVKWFLKQASPIIENLPQKPEAYFASIEPTGPRHVLSGSQQGIKKNNQNSISILQVKNEPLTTSITTTPITNKTTQIEKANLKPINNITPQNLINNQNNTANEKDKLTNGNIYNKSAINFQMPNKIITNNATDKHVETRPAIAEEKPPNEQLKTIEWAYDYNNIKTEQDTATKNHVVPITNIQATDDKSDVTMAILHVANQQEQNINNAADINANKNIKKNINANIDINSNAPTDQNSNFNLSANNDKTFLDNNIHGAKLGAEVWQLDWFRIYVVGAFVVIFSALFYLSLRFLRTHENEKQLLPQTQIQNETEPIIIKAEIIANNTTTSNEKSQKINRHKQNKKIA
ncbi:MAG: serine protease [Planctomycetaceae bacterium]|nr:serine protease [Planctomycetaceae bacterium]